MLFKQIEGENQPLSHYVKKIFQGLVTSADPVYILEKKDKKYFSKYLEEDVEMEDLYLKPLLKGSEIVEGFLVIIAFKGYVIELFLFAFYTMKNASIGSCC